MIRMLIFLVLIVIQLPSLATDQVVNIYNWSNYMPKQVIQEFERKTGIHVNYMEFNSNATLYAKLKADPNIGFDIIVPSSYYVQRMRQQDMLHPLDLNRIPNHRYLNPELLNKPFDPHNRYSLPYIFGATGIVVNEKYHNQNRLRNWQDLWNPKYHNQLLMLNDVREVFGIALISLGYSINDTNPQHIHQAYLKLRKLMPNIKLFNSDAEINIYVDEDATIGMGWNGDINLAHRENPHIHFIYPQPHYGLWIDCVAIPKYAPHLNNAYRFLNFIMQPKIAAQISETEGYSSPNVAAIKLLPEAMRNNPILNPSREELARSEVENDIGNADVIYEHYWQLLKLGS